MVVLKVRDGLGSWKLVDNGDDALALVDVTVGGWVGEWVGFWRTVSGWVGGSECMTTTNDRQLTSLHFTAS